MAYMYRKVKKKKVVFSFVHRGSNNYNNFIYQ